ncbi:hypothetical protein [Nonomuraea dietziae]|uniref:hypothetical protein n=1 Tax=Nonomuraea dietziae TaxID=65515 RepID=UPI0033F2470A
MAIGAGRLPLYLRAGAGEEIEIGHIEVQLLSAQSGGTFSVSVDTADIRRRIAHALRDAADQLEAVED